MDFLVISGCGTHFKSELCQNQLRQTRKDKLQMKFSALNVDFDGPSLVLGSRKPAQTSARGHQRAVVKVVRPISPLFACLS